jgi:glutathione-specific gamma-glutamylcyclotransferase
MSGAVFGYGSLVNAATRRSGLPCETAQVDGWAREWGHLVTTPHGRTCVLTVRRSPTTRIVGALLSVTASDLEEFDRREISYGREQVEASTGARNRAAWLYVGKPANHGRASRSFPIWRSYVDCVLAGYLELGGTAELDAFIDSTTGWDGPMLDDRAAPRYPRAVGLKPAQEREIEAALEKRGHLDALFADATPFTPGPRRPAS